MPDVSWWPKGHRRSGTVEPAANARTAGDPLNILTTPIRSGGSGDARQIVSRCEAEWLAARTSECARLLTDDDSGINACGDRRRRSSRRSSQRWLWVVGGRLEGR